MASMTSTAPSRSCTSAGCTSAPTSRPQVSVTMWRLRPPAFAGQAFDLLGRILPRVAALPRPRTGSTARPTALGGLDRLTVDDPGRWARFTSRCFACFQQQRKIDLLKQAVVSPIVEITLHD